MIEAETCYQLVTLNKINIDNSNCVLTCESLLRICVLNAFLGADFLLSLQVMHFRQMVVFIVFKINAAKRNNVIVQQYRFTIQMVRFRVGYKFRTAKCMGVFLWDVLDRPNVGLLYTVFSLSLSLSLFYGASVHTRVMVFSIEASRHTQTNHIR